MKFFIYKFKAVLKISAQEVAKIFEQNIDNLAIDPGLTSPKFVLSVQFATSLYWITRVETEDIQEVC